MTDAVVSTRRLGKTYGRHRALEGLDLDVAEGEIFGFLGPNGAGKSTTIRILLGLLRASEGEARIFGQDCWRRGVALRAEVGYLPGDVRFPERGTGRRFVEHLAALRGRRCDFEGLAGRLELDLDRPIRAYSKGMKQKLGVIQALMHDPRVAILDEPTSGLDPITQREVDELLRERSRAGTTVFFSSHVLPEVEGLCERVALLRRGRLVRCGRLAELEELATRRFELPCRDAEVAGSIAGEIEPAVVEVRVEGPVVVGLTDDVNRLLDLLAGRDRSGLRLESLRLEDLFHELYEPEREARSHG